MLDDIDMLTEENLKSKEQVLEANYQKKQSELLAYRNQINPHFMHNTFECIRGMALLYEVPDIAEISEEIREGLQICYVKKMEEVLKIAMNGGTNDH